MTQLKKLVFLMMFSSVSILPAYAMDESEGSDDPFADIRDKRYVSSLTPQAQQEIADSIKKYDQEQKDKISAVCKKYYLEVNLNQFVDDVYAASQERPTHIHEYGIPNMYNDIVFLYYTQRRKLDEFTLLEDVFAAIKEPLHRQDLWEELVAFQSPPPGNLGILMPFLDPAFFEFPGLQQKLLSLPYKPLEGYSIRAQSYLFGL